MGRMLWVRDPGVVAIGGTSTVDIAPVTLLLHPLPLRLRSGTGIPESTLDALVPHGL